MLAPPVTYEIDGEQYVVYIRRHGGLRRISSGSRMIPPQSNTVTLVNYWPSSLTQMSSCSQLFWIELYPNNQLTASAPELIRGEQLYNVSCGRCHGGNARSGGVIPDLRMMSSTTSIFNDIVVDGIYKGKGMAAFGDILNEKDTEMIRQYVISRALIDKAEAEA